MATATRAPGDAELEAQARELYRAMCDLIRVYQFRDRELICCHGLSVTQCYALSAIVRGAPLGLNELAAHLYLDKSTASRVVDALEKKGYAERRTDPADGRAVRLSATPTGEELHARIEGEFLVGKAELLRGYSPETRREMGRMVRELARAAAARVDTSGGCCRVTGAP